MVAHNAGWNVSLDGSRATSMFLMHKSGLKSQQILLQANAANHWTKVQQTPSEQRRERGKTGFPGADMPDARAGREIIATAIDG